MRRSIAALLLAPVLAGCASQSVPAPAPKAQWRFAEVLQRDYPAAECPGTPLSATPVLAGVHAYGLEGRLSWVPGSADKVNWMAVDAGRGSVKLSLRRPEEPEAVYSAEVQPMPSLIEYPGPGCWELNVERGGRSESTHLFLEPARPVGLLSARGGDPYVADTDEVSTWLAPEAALALLDAVAASPGEIPADRPMAEIHLAMSVGGADRVIRPMLYLPAHGGSPPMVALSRSLLTGDCRQQAPAAAAISADVAAQIEEGLGDSLLVSDQPLNPWANYQSSCTQIEPG